VGLLKWETECGKQVEEKRRSLYRLLTNEITPPCYDKKEGRRFWFFLKQEYMKTE